MSNCHCHTTINRDGSGQLHRYLQALDPAYAPVDGRSLEDLLVYAKRYAAQVRFYDIPGSAPEDDTPSEKVSWREFFRRDMAVIAASIAVTDLAQLKKDYDENRTRLEQQPQAKHYANLFDPILGLMTRMDHWYSLAIPENPLHADLHLAITSSLQAQVKQMIAYEEGFKLVDAKNSFTLDFSAIENDAIWKINDPVDPDVSIYEGATPEAQIRHAALFVDAVFLAFYGVISEVVNNGEKYLQFALQQYPAHQPHMALFIAFLQLFRLAQEQMNTLTGRILDFYYREVLQLKEKPAIPDRAHVVFELAKDVATYDLAPGTALDAGKDAAGRDQVYITESPLVINQARVKELKTLFIEKLPPEVTQENKTIATLYARPVANSLDGYGEKFTDPYPKWATFGKGRRHPGQPKNICDTLAIINDELHTKNETAIGFAIASPQLVLQGGNRLITLKVSGLRELFTGGNAGVWLSAEEGWLTISRQMTKAEFDGLLSEELFVNEQEAGTSYYIDEDSSNTLQIFLPVSEKAIIPFDPKLHTGRAYNTPYPVMQIMTGPDVQLPAFQYKYFTHHGLSLAVRVGSINHEPVIGVAAAKTTYANFDGLKALTLQNDDGAIAPGKPFDPFTAYPRTGSAFYIGSHEAFNKPLKALSVNILHVSSDDPLQINESSVDYRVSLLQNRQWTRLSTIRLGRDTFTEYELTYDILNVGGNGDNEPSTPIDTIRTPLAYPAGWENGITSKGFLQVVNNYYIDPGAEDFFQRSAALAAVFKIREVSLSYYSELPALEAGIDQLFHVYPFGAAEVDLQPPPDNERLKRLSALAAGSTGFQNLAAALGREKNGLLVDAEGSLLPQFTWVSPYEQYRQDDDDNETADTAAGLAVNSSSRAAVRSTSQRYMNRLMLSASGIGEVRRINQYSGTIQEEGMLFIGLEKLQPLQTLSLLFRFAEGTAEDEENDPPPVHWSYLSNNEWRPLKGEHIIYDGTYGFQATGIVKIDVPEDATSNNTIITGGLHWFCASVTEHANRFPWLVDVIAQAVEAVFTDNGNAPSHYDKALPAGSISKLSVKVAEVSKVQQPFASFDGKPAEAGKVFHTRVSERLRHKGRAITTWDYEHLVLDRFPEIYKVKCIPHTDPHCLCRDYTGPQADGEQEQAVCCGPQPAPGHVLLVAIANLQNRNATDPLRPKTSRRTLLAIEDYLGKRSAPFVRIRARNPLYEQVLVFFRVQFVSGTDKGYYLKKLNEEIVHFLTPWAFDENAEVQFGQKIYASAIINFIEERPYVDFITDFLLFVCRNECCPPEANGDDNNKDNDMPAVLDRLHSCHDVERLLQEQLKFIGVVVAEPSTSRSILVSVPQHIIVPYEAPERPSPCEQRASRQDRAVLPVTEEPRPGTATGIRSTATATSGTTASPAGRAAASKAATEAPPKAAASETEAAEPPAAETESAAALPPDKITADKPARKTATSRKKTTKKNPK